MTLSILLLVGWFRRFPIQRTTHREGNLSLTQPALKRLPSSRALTAKIGPVPNQQILFLAVVAKKINIFLSKQTVVGTLKSDYFHRSLFITIQEKNLLNRLHLWENNSCSLTAHSIQRRGPLLQIFNRPRNQKQISRPAVSLPFPDQPSLLLKIFPLRLFLH